MRQWWFAPEKIETGKHAQLLPSATSVIRPSSKPIKNAMPMSIYMMGVYVHKSFDGVLRTSTTNDLMVVSTFQTGNSPIVQRVHFYEHKQTAEKWVGNFFKTLVCSFGDFNAKHITLRTQVYDIDNYDKFRDILSAISGMSGNVAVTFPQAAPFVASAIPAASRIIDLIDSLDSHDRIIDSRLRVEIAKENIGAQILQTGHWVCFSEAQDNGLKINSNLRILDRHDHAFNKCSYAVYSIRAAEAQEPNWERDQKVAKLLSELAGKGNSGRAAIDFLRETMDGYTRFKKLTRIRELESKAKLTKEEETLLKKLKSDKSIKPFLA